jgi:disulfide bond formation protein DsbB
MNWLFHPRSTYFLITVACAALLGYGLYIQHADFVDPCPLCVFQRLAFIGIGSVALLAGIHYPGPMRGWFYGSGVIVGGIAGASIAGWHLWLQNLPPDQVPDCGMGLNYMLETMPLTEVLTQVFQGSGECAEIAWTFLGLSMPGWTFVWYTGFTVVTIFGLVRMNRTKA